jgi:hypothetical protein
MCFTSSSVSRNLVASCKQGYEFNNSKHGRRNQFNFISMYSNYIFISTVAGTDDEKNQGEGKADIWVIRKKIILRACVPFHSYCKTQFKIRFSVPRTSGS